MNKSGKMHCSVTWLLQQKINLQVCSTSLVDGYYMKVGCGTMGEFGLEFWEGLGNECISDESSTFMGKMTRR